MMNFLKFHGNFDWKMCGKLSDFLRFLGIRHMDKLSDKLSLDNL